MKIPCNDCAQAKKKGQQNLMHWYSANCHGVGADCWSFVSVCNVGYGRTVVDMKTRFWDASAWIEQRKIVEQGQEEDFEVIEKTWLKSVALRDFSD